MNMTNLVRVRPGLWLTELHLDEFDVRGAVLMGAERAIVWDTLSHPRDMAAVAPLVAGHWHAVVYSHADWDHCWGTAGLSERRIVVGHSNCRLRFETEAPQTLRAKQSAEPGEWQEIQLIPPTQLVQEHLSIDLGSLTLELHHLPGHTVDCLVGFVPEWGVLLAGDAVETPLPVVNADSPMPEWLAGLQRWAEDVRVQTVIPAHGAIGGREVIWDNIDYIQSLLKGTSSAPLVDLKPFYRETHSENLRHVHKMRPMQL
jgi:glyoxylase-like metal-dependent hydrolase (beta-lactamase superfamily II)